MEITSMTAKKTPNRNEIEVGQTVEIQIRSKDSKNEFERGKVREILTRNLSHPHGILVRLDSGAEGRVKSIEFSKEPSLLVSSAIESTSISSGNFNKLTLKEILERTEDHSLEFKESLLWSQDLTKDNCDKGSAELKRYGRNTSKVIVAKSIAAFLNADGGLLLIGVREDKKTGENIVVGIEEDYKRLKDKCADGYRRFIVDSIVEPLFPAFVYQRMNSYINLHFINSEQGTVCIIVVKKAESKVFLTIQKESLFYIRVDASNRQLKGEAVVDYCMRRFT